MNCCITNDMGQGSRPAEAACSTDESNETNLCGSCKRKGRPVSRKTVLLMLKPDLLERAMHGSYSFCSARDCPVVYFEEQGSHRFNTNDLRIPVGAKAKIDPIPLCYCFGFDESHIRDQISQTGTTNIPQRISALIREGLCACQSRNPAGVSCLGEVNRAANTFYQSEE
jgi:hypothetical protein